MIEPGDLLIPLRSGEKEADIRSTFAELSSQGISPARAEEIIFP